MSNRIALDFPEGDPAEARQQLVKQVAAEMGKPEDEVDEGLFPRWTRMIESYLRQNVEKLPDDDPKRVAARRALEVLSATEGRP